MLSVACCNTCRLTWCCASIACLLVLCKPAAGGRFRGSIGRVLFRTTGVFQSVLEPDVATNKVGVARLGADGGEG